LVRMACRGQPRSVTRCRRSNWIVWASPARYAMPGIQATLAELTAKGAEMARDVSDQGWGLLAAIRLPDGSELAVYQPRHPSPART
jgi:predicted enzyme related to lactoylglutathione lyase